jgi:hypothetical protein
MSTDDEDLVPKIIRIFLTVDGLRVAGSLGAAPAQARVCGIHLLPVQGHQGSALPSGNLFLIFDIEKEMGCSLPAGLRRDTVMQIFSSSYRKKLWELTVLETSLLTGSEDCKGEVIDILQKYKEKLRIVTAVPLTFVYRRETLCKYLKS